MANPTFAQFEAIIYDSLRKKQQDPHPWLTSLEAYADMIEGKAVLPHLPPAREDWQSQASPKKQCTECLLAWLRRRRTQLQVNEQSIAHYPPGGYEAELIYIENRIRTITENRTEDDSLTGYEIKSKGFRIPFYAKPSV